VKLNRISTALCAGFMLGVSIPVIIASLVNGGFIVIFGLLMFLFSLVLLSQVSKPLNLLKKVLLILHAAVALVVLIAILKINPHIFLIIWSITILALSVISWVSHEKNETSK
jgi:hypothetical protein